MPFLHQKTCLGNSTNCQRNLIFKNIHPSVQFLFLSSRYAVHTYFRAWWNMYLLDSLGASQYPTEMMASNFRRKHIKRLQSVFHRNHVANININPKIFAFVYKNVQFLGHLSSKNRLEADPEKVKTVQNSFLTTKPNSC